MHSLVAFEKVLFSTPFRDFRRSHCSHGWSGLAAPTTRREVLHMHGRLASARGPAYRLGAWTSVRSPSYAREVRCGERSTLARVCCCRRPYGPCAHRSYYFSCARNARGLCCVRVPRLGVCGASQPHAVHRREPTRAAASSTIPEPVRALARLARPPANAYRFCSVACPIMWARCVGVAGKGDAAGAPRRTNMVVGLDPYVLGTRVRLCGSAGHS